MCFCYGREGEQDCLNQICQLSCGELPLLCVANDGSGNAGGCSMWFSYILGCFCDYVLKLIYGMVSLFQCTDGFYCELSYRCQG